MYRQCLQVPRILLTDCDAFFLLHLNELFDINSECWQAYNHWGFYKLVFSEGLKQCPSSQQLSKF